MISRQTSLDHDAYLQHEIQKVAMDLIESNWIIGENAPIHICFFLISYILSNTSIILAGSKSLTSYNRELINHVLYAVSFAFSCFPSTKQ